MPAQRRVRPRRPAEQDAEPGEPVEDQPPEDEETPRSRASGLSAGSAGATGQRHIVELTSRQSEGITLVKPEGDGWVVNVEVVEDRRIPSSGDILALYQVELDGEGELRSYRRLRRYRRGSGDQGEGG
ncbi:gas vesicle protein [Nonomuraea sp. KC401]|uniref:gas vesicle protein GvpO n=1 Tax=unclassified Nonomuraea TaxID=2593643 RepID=UPI0010FE872F|nr:gas vesicle protein GvpO [Nonomuraea sp. KC401]NBE94619.1 gas vesicle protein [Nonomuraea sp. K271]TLF72640.1 gas vesicle protein [Nonomuraea sp. KC401]